MYSRDIKKQIIRNLPVLGMVKEHPNSTTNHLPQGVAAPYAAKLLQIYY